MSEQLKIIIQELNRSPFNENYNIISFDALDGRKLLFILSKVLVQIDPLQKIDFGSEQLEDGVQRILNMLQLFKYPFPENDVEEFEKQILVGDVSTLRDLLEWLLTRIPELKKRAYLGRFLLRLDIPQEFLGDVEISELYNQYLEMIEQFKENHKVAEQLRMASLSTNEIKQDIDNLLEEKKQLIKRVDKLKKRINSFENVEEILDVSRNLRQERDKEENLNVVKQEQRNAIHHLDQRIQRLKSLIVEMKHTKSDATPEALIKNLEQELQVSSYIAQDKYPKEMKVLQNEISDMEKVVSDNDLRKSDLNAMYTKIQDLNSKIGKMVEKKMMTNDPMDDKLSMFRQQAAIISRKKETIAENIKELRNELNSLENQLKEKQAQLKELGGVEILKGDEFKAYVAKLRGKSDDYKRKRQDQNEIRAELGVLSRTAEILKKRFEESEETLSALEAEKGISGYRNYKELIAGVEDSEQKEESVTELSKVVRQLNNQIQSKKITLSPIVKEVQHFRQIHQDLMPDYEEKKSAYNSVAAGLEANYAKLEREVKALMDEYNSIESQIYYLRCSIKIKNVQTEQAKAEMKSYLSGDPNVKKHSLREQFSQCIQEQEKLAKTLKDEQKNIRETHESNLKQMKMWQDLQRLLECKRKIAVKS